MRLLCFKKSFFFFELMIKFSTELNWRIIWKFSITSQLNISAQFVTKSYQVPQVCFIFHNYSGWGYSIRRFRILWNRFNWHGIKNLIFQNIVLAEHKLQHCKVISGKCFHCSESIKDIGEFKHHTQSHNQKNKNSLELPVHCICCHQLLTSDFEINLHAKWVL